MSHLFSSLLFSNTTGYFATLVAQRSECVTKVALHGRQCTPHFLFFLFARGSRLCEPGSLFALGAMSSERYVHWVFSCRGQGREREDGFKNHGRVRICLLRAPCPRQTCSIPHCQ